jgi:NAD(P)-dependent dehydrogenase (short-subunit alcohol dehydrogenase family)
MRALVTGAGRRLGAVMARELGRMGYAVALHYATSADGAVAAAAEIEAGGGRAATVQADLLDLSACDTLVGRAAEALGGPLTVLVNNASIFEHDDIRTATHESWDRHIGSNLRAPFILTQAFAAQTPEAEAGPDGRPLATGCVVNLIDQRVRKLTPEFMTYTLAKSALWTLTQTAAQALAPSIRVNAIGPGPTMQGDRQSAAHFAAQREATLLRRGSDEGDIAAALRYLLTAPAVTGQMICVDGGQHLAWQTPDVLGVE